MYVTFLFAFDPIFFLRSQTLSFPPVCAYPPGLSLTSLSATFRLGDSIVRIPRLHTYKTHRLQNLLKLCMPLLFIYFDPKLCRNPQICGCTSVLGQILLTATLRSGESIARVPRPHATHLATPDGVLDSESQSRAFLQAETPQPGPSTHQPSIPTTPSTFTF